MIDKILCGDALTELKKIPSEYVDCIITSPPYWALRDYKTEGQIGLEKTIDEYINNLINVFDECKRVLKKDGTCWVVLGDTYSTKSGGMEDLVKYGKDTKTYGKLKYKFDGVKQTYKSNQGIQDKSLCMVPERFAIKMIDNEWILRNKIIWKKNNCMPSSAKDRFTVDYEYIYFFTKSQKYYFRTQYEPYAECTLKEFEKVYNGKGIKDYLGNGVQNPSDVKRNILGGKRRAGTKNLMYKGQNINSFHKPDSIFEYSNLGRIKRCVWTINTAPFKEAHFAVFPEELVKQCLDAGCPDNGIIFDPFMGSGTTALVALKNNRHFLGIELSQEYIDIALKRIKPYLYQTKLVVDDE